MKTVNTPDALNHYPESANTFTVLTAQHTSQQSADSLQPSGGSEGFTRPVILLDTPGTLNAASPACTAVFAAEHLQWTSHGDLHCAAGATLATVSGNATSLFTHTGGFQGIAANGPVSVQAHTEALEILADQAVTVSSVNGCIQIKARQKIVLQAGQSTVTLEGSNITFTCPGTFSVKGSAHPFGGGARGKITMPHLPSDAAPGMNQEFFVLKDEKTGKPLKNWPYEVKTADGTRYTAATDMEGNTQRIITMNAENVVVEALPDDSAKTIFQASYWNSGGTSDPLMLDFANNPEKHIDGD